MPIGIGINENVLLTKVAISDKGSLEITFDEKATVMAPKASVFDSLQTAKVENTGSSERMMLVFPFKPPTGPRNADKTEDELIEMTSDDMLKVKNQLTQLLEQFLTSDKIVWDPYAGTGIDNTNYRERFRDEDALKRVFDNYAGQFIQMVSPFLGDPAYALRVKLVRQSQDKHYATIPGKFLADNPWVELMEVPAQRVNFTKWEKDNGLNDGTPKAKPENANDAPPEGDNAFKFGQRG